MIQDQSLKRNIAVPLNIMRLTENNKSDDLIASAHHEDINMMSLSFLSF